MKLLQNRGRFFLQLCILLLLLIIFQPIVVSASGAVEAEGNGETKTEAIHDAQRNAVEMVLGAMLSSETLVENFVLLKDKILTRVQGYVKNFKILSQSCDTNGCIVKISAEVEEMALADDVAALAKILPRMNYPTVVVSVVQKTLSQKLDSVPIDISTVEQTMGKIISDKGFRVSEASAMEAEKLRQASLMKMTGNNLGNALELASHLAQVIISGQAIVQDNGASPYNERIHSYGAFISAKAYQTGTGHLLASASTEANVPHHSFAIGTQKALEKAAEQLIEKISKQIIQSWLDDCYNDHDISLIVENISFSKLSALKKNILANINGVARVNQKSFLRKRADIVVGWANCNTQRFAEKIEELSISSGNLEILEVQGNTIRVHYSKK